MRTWLGLFVMVLSACPPPPPPPPADAGPSEECLVTAPTTCTQTQLRWADIEPIIQQRCVPCHDGSQPQWPLRTYTDVADWSDIVRQNVVDCAMPPLDGGIQVGMTNVERRLILDWIKCDFPR